jgi:UDP-GlcNAc:undecaprenyl-phosphate/decaprenyl-phosphate GlcNAc-1-phosphate transferase
MIAFIFAGLTSFIISLVLLPFIIRISKKRNFYDEPERRRIHKKVTPSFGGVAIFFGFAIASVIWEEPAKRTELFILLGVLFIPFVLGFLDDIIHLRPSMKILAQTAAATIVFFILKVKIVSLYGVFSMPIFRK